MSLALLYETILLIVVGLIPYVAVMIGIANEIGNGTSPKDPKELLVKYIHDHVGTVSIFTFINAFLVAAFVEELAKYFGYFMVETPDLMDPNDMEINDNTEDTSRMDDLVLSASSGRPQQNDTSSLRNPPRSMVSRGAAITIAMVATATGFACSENVTYVLYGSRHGFMNGLYVLILRSAFPIHPFFGALQSIGVVKRDLEKDPKIGLGRIILPAILLHGSFDFILMLESVLTYTPIPHDASFPPPITKLKPADFIGLAIASGVILLFIVYYAVASKKQRLRLKAMDEQQSDHDNGEDTNDGIEMSATSLVQNGSHGEEVQGAHTEGMNL
eukprot:CAMPEP_0116836716 /NCGR_PEP_ID=MMETSP0418-20121206/8254_1 /TAXON_ID=1158023 /ORGANISM="Astrosyne radiata, Strain 13vi08-1A" /LENGTH=329 /DNA_ID=CAMNT_0004466523 /DNA_START=280 /DNA_END=1269 /DNA_ORIENTATION=+